MAHEVLLRDLTNMFDQIGGHFSNLDKLRDAFGYLTIVLADEDYSIVKSTMELVYLGQTHASSEDDIESIKSLLKDNHPVKELIAGMGGSDSSLQDPKMYGQYLDESETQQVKCLDAEPVSGDS